jgi:hypothetical protein
MARKKEHLKGINLVKAQLETPGTKFNYQFKLGRKVEKLIIKDGYVTNGIDQMNVEEFGPKCVWLYSYDMAGNRTRAKVRYEDVEVTKSDFVDPLDLEQPEDEVVEEVVEEVEEAVEVEA